MTGKKEIAAIARDERLSLEERLDQIEAQVRAKPVEREDRITFVCPTCHTEDTIVVDPIPGGVPGTLAVQIARLFRQEIRHSALTAPHADRSHTPPFDWAAERAVLTASLCGIEWPKGRLLSRRHFFSPLHGAIWELSRDGIKDVGLLAARLEADRVCDKIIAAHTILDLSSPHVAAACDAATVDRLLRVGWQRELHYRSAAMAALTANATDLDPKEIRKGLLSMLAQLDAGPEGDDTLAEIESTVRAAGGDVSPEAIRDRAEKYEKHRDIVYQVASVQAWLARDIAGATGPEEKSPKNRLLKLLKRLDATRDVLYDIYAKLSGESP